MSRQQIEGVGVLARGDLVETWFDTGAMGAQILYGEVIAAGPKAYRVRWESGLTNRLPQGHSDVQRARDSEQACAALTRRRDNSARADVADRIPPLEAALASAAPKDEPAPVAHDVALEAWHLALNDAGELRSNAPDIRYQQRAARVEAWILGHRPAPPPASLNEPSGDSGQLPDDAPFPEGWDEGRKYRCVRTGRQPPSEGEDKVDWRAMTEGRSEDQA